MTGTYLGEVSGYAPETQWQARNWSTLCWDAGGWYQSEEWEARRSRGGLSVCQSQVPADVDSHIIVLQEMQGHDAAPNASLGLKRKAAVFGARTTLFAGHQAWLNVLPSRFNQAWCLGWTVKRDLWTSVEDWGGLAVLRVSWDQWSSVCSQRSLQRWCKRASTSAVPINPVCGASSLVQSLPWRRETFNRAWSLGCLVDPRTIRQVHNQQVHVWALDQIVIAVTQRFTLLLVVVVYFVKYDLVYSIHFGWNGCHLPLLSSSKKAVRECDGERSTFGKVL